MSRGPLKIALSFRDLEARSDFSGVLADLPWIEVVELASGAAFDLIIHQAADQGEEDLDMALGLADGGEVMLAGTSPEPELLIAAMRKGVHEFVPIPCRREELMQALERFRKRISAGLASSRSDRGRIITVAGGKAGIGTTTLAVNLAYELNLADPGGVALMDLRCPEGEAPLFLDLEYSYTWEDVVQNLVRLDQTYLASVMAVHSSGLAVLPAPDFETSDSVGLNAESVRDILFELASGYRNVVVDTLAGLDEVTLRVLSISDEIRLPVVLSLPCLARVKRFLENVRTLDPEMESRISLVVNRHAAGSQIDVEEAGRILGHRAALFVPDDYKTTLAALNQGKALADCFPKSAVRAAVADMAGALAAPGNAETGEKRSGGLFSVFKRKRREAPALPEPEFAFEGQTP